MESGDEAFSQQRYSEALRFYLQALKENPSDDALKEKITLCYFREGEIFYEKRKVIKAFEARVKSGLKHLPSDLSDNMSKTISNIYFKLAQAYQTSKADNPYQQKKFFDHALNNLERSLAYDSTNTQASLELQIFKEAHFEEMLDKGIFAYKKGRRDALQYIAADHYLSNALKLDPENKQAQKYLRLTRKRALNVLDPGLDVPLAITDQMVNTDYLAFLVVVYNLLPDNLYVNPANFYLVKNDGGEIRGKSTPAICTLGIS
jgi:tetratricopeptide (TPR) repeat protein